MVHGNARRVLAAVCVCMLCWLMLASEGWAADQIVTAKGHVYMRKGPGTNYDIMVVLQPNSELKVEQTSGDWYKVKYGKKSGYVRKDVVNEYAGATASVPTSASPSASTAASGTYRTLKKGMSGDDVRALQIGLIYAGHMDTMPHETYDDNTVIAVKAYQKANNLKADGIAGDATQRKLLGDPATVATTEGNAAIVEESTGSGVITVPADNGLLKLGSKGDQVRALQSQLQALGYLSSKPDGGFGPETESALKAFQKANKLSADGVAGQATQSALATASAKASTSAAGNASASASLLKEGSSGTSVSQMQSALLNLGYYTGKVTGSFGSLTQEAVKAFQRANGLSADGVAGSSTLNKLYSGSAVAKSGSSTSNNTASNGNNNVTASGSTPSAASVKNVNWFTSIRTKYKAGTVVTIYDFRTGLSWKCRFMSNGNHADSEPLTSTDTNTMYQAFGKKTTWNPKAVWVTMPDGNTFIASMHNTPHLSGSIKDNNFDGHLCIHFPREMSEAEKTGPYAVTHQKEIQKGWEETQKLAGR